jgi:hypothetical protein
VSSRDRITIPEDMSNLARDTEREFAATGSDVRPILPMHAVPWMVLTYDRVQRLPLDSRAGFVISLVDGKCTVEMILDISGMPEDETLDILRELERLGAIQLRDPK